MAEMKFELYDMNKQIMNTRPALSEKEVDSHIAEIATWFSYVQDTYFMLLCHERRDYTLFHFSNGRKRYYEASRELLETLLNRGEILDIAFETQNVYAIWVKVGGDSFLYHLFPYDQGVITV